jgi:hypothetical protein
MEMLKFQERQLRREKRKYLKMVSQRSKENLKIGRRESTFSFSASLQKPTEKYNARKLNINTVKSPLDGHLRDYEKLSALGRCPLKGQTKMM